MVLMSLSKRHLPVRILIALVCMGLVLGGKPWTTETAQARTIDEITSEISTLNGQVSRLEQEIGKLQGQIDEKKGEIRSLSNDIASLTAEIDKIGLEIQNTETKIKLTETEIEKTTIEIRTKEHEISENKKLLAEYLRLIAEADTVNPFEILLSGKSFSDILNQFEYTETLQKKTQESLEQVKQLKFDLEKKQAELEQQRAEAMTLQTQLNGQRDGLAAKRADKDRLLALSKDEQKKYEGLLAQNEDLQKQAQADIANLEKELAEQTGGIPSGAPPPSAGVLGWPADGIEVQSYGMTDYAKGGAYGGEGHNGIDVAAPLGSPVFAAADGVVSGIGDLGGVAYGSWITVAHGELGFDTLYGHLLAQKVSVGQTVKRGEVIGVLGSTGYSSGPHVHFMVCFNLQTVERPYGLLPYCNHVNPHLYL